MISTCEHSENGMGCQWVVCPLASELKKCEQHVRQMEQLIMEHRSQMSRMGMLFRLMADAMEGIADKLPASTTKADREQILCQCIVLLMEAKDSKGKFLFRRKSHWQAVYRIIVDRKLGVADGDYAGFESLVWKIEPPGCRIPFSPSALKQISKTNFTKPFQRWCYDPVYFKTRKPYDQMVEVAEKFIELLDKNGL